MAPICVTYGYVFSWGFMSYGAQIADSVRVTLVLPTLVGFSHMYRFCWRRRALQPAASESPGSCSRSASKASRVRVTQLKLAVRADEGAGNGRTRCYRA